MRRIQTEALGGESYRILELIRREWGECYARGEHGVL